MYASVPTTSPVRVLERTAERESDPEHVAVRQHALRAEFVDGPPVHQFGDQVARPGVLAGVEDGNNTRVIQTSRRERLAAAALRIAGRRGGDHLDRDAALQSL